MRRVPPATRGRPRTAGRRADAELPGLREKAAAFEALVGHFPDLYFKIGESGVIRDYRAHVSMELYAPPEQFLGRNVSDILPPEAAASITCALRETLTTGAITTAEYALPMPIGEQWYEARLLATAERDVVCFIRNITTAVRARDSFARTVSLLRATLDATADAILAVDKDGRIETFNTNFVQLWGIPDHVLATRDDERAIGFVLEQLIEPEIFQARIRELYADPDAESHDVLAFRDGRIVERSSRPMRGPGRTGGRVWSFRDITEALRNQQERDRLLHESREAVRARDEFLSIASHELRTPLTSLRLSLQSLRRATREAGSPPDPGTLETLLGTAERQTRTLGKLVEELLSVGRIQAGRLDLAAEDVDLAAVVRDVLKNLAEDVARAGATVSFAEPNEAVVGKWDRSRIEQVVTNVVTNALRYGAGAPIDIALTSDGRHAQLEVRDHGQGIAPELQRRIFERFERGVPSSHYGGLGLGLYIVRQILRAHNGDVTVRSEEGQGATFTITLPMGGAGTAT